MVTKIFKVAIPPEDFSPSGGTCCSFDWQEWRFGRSVLSSSCCSDFIRISRPRATTVTDKQPTSGVKFW